MSSQAASAPFRRRKLTNLQYFALAAVVAVAGGAATGLLVRDEPRLAPPVEAPEAQRFALGESIDTHFGVMSADRVYRITPRMASNLSHGSHGVRVHVDPGTVQLHVAVSLTNLLDRPWRYSPDDFRLRLERDAGSRPLQAGPTPASTPGRSIEPMTATKIVLVFVAPPQQAHLRLHSQAGERPVTVHLGRSVPSSRHHHR
ncbi:MAG: hypothetical protein ACRDHO_00010 [Actinomycetota bacterium]